MGRRPELEFNSLKCPKNPGPAREKCLATARESGRKWRKENREAYNAIRRRHRLRHPAWALWSKAKERARRLGLPFNIIVEDVVIPVVCPVLDIPLVWGSPTQVDASPTLDRINSSLGYVRGNVKVISWRANKLKSNATVDELARLWAYAATA